ncbi:MAG: hypothetical protein KME35_20540 [Aphanocapsa sp. GSE-SYN-MK-11-07L]|jgi:hypothetical protein|nr:hypothetical protein [Aphanocapsa sp. GSE-SYN-MK-11-07L]
MPPVIVVLILAIALTPALLSWWGLRQTDRCTLRSGRRSEQTQRVLRPALASREQVGDLTYRPGVGYWIGDFSCRYNARSAYLRCAVNPAGPCQTCHLYESLSLDS